jgi:hypothetical protein
VGPGQEAHLRRKGADLIEGSSVGALVIVQNPASDDFLFDLIDAFAHFGCLVGIGFLKMREDFLRNRVDAFFPGFLVVGIQSYG